MSRIVVALGGNALVRDAGHASIPDQLQMVEEFAPSVVDLVLDGHEVVITHGNGPQVGYILRRSEISRAEVAPIPIDYAVGDTQGAIGHMFLLAMRNELRRRAVDRSVAAVVTQVLIDADDPALHDPAKPIGAFFDEAHAAELAASLGWTVREDSGRGWRRVVPSPAPIAILEADLIATLLGASTIVVACGGGGIPVVLDDEGRLHGVEAVVDKDHTSALLADVIGADALVILTTTEQVAVGFGRPEQRWLSSLTTAEAGRLLSDGEFGEGSMLPKIEAALRFVDGRAGISGQPRFAVITTSANLANAIMGSAGTRIVTG